jgi:hypothetical protein
MNPRVWQMVNTASRDGAGAPPEQPAVVRCLADPAQLRDRGDR